MSNKLYNTELLRELCLTFGPTSGEGEVADLITEQIKDLTDEISRDRMGNVYAYMRSGREGAPLLMLSSHMDEVGFIVKSIDDKGYIKFLCVGGIDPRVLSGKHVVLCGEQGKVYGVIASKAIHLLSPDERKTATKVENLYIDIGADSREEAERYVAKGDLGTFDSEFVSFGEGERFFKCKAIDDRLGCCAMIETMRRLKDEGEELPVDICFAFTVREEIGKSGAQVAAQRIRPEYSVVLESTAIADLPDVKPSARVSEVGGGGVISLLDRSTIYDREFVDFALSLAKEKGVFAQVKKYVSGGNDAGHIHKSGTGVKCLAISAPTRYLHSAACVTSYADYEAIRDLVYHIIVNFDRMNKRK